MHAMQVPQMTALPAAQGAHIRLDALSHQFGTGARVLESIDLDFAAGSFTAILGPSGCGKSTLLRLIAGLAWPTAGHVEVACRPDELAYVFQDAHLLPWRNVLQNVALPLELRGRRRSERSDAARKAIELVGLSAAAELYPAQLSGGMRMRASLARAMVARPRLLLLDEPFAALDEITRQRLDEELRRLWLAEHMTVIFVTHSTSEAVFLAERAIVLSPRPGRLAADLPVDLSENRTAQLRTEPVFAQIARDLYAALESAGTAR